MATTPLAKEAAFSALLTGADETSERVRERVSGLISVPMKTLDGQKNRRPESRSSTKYKTGYVPNTNTKESMKITKRARFSAQNHLLTYPVYKSAYSEFCLKHPKIMRAGRNAIKRADTIPPFKAALDLKDKTAERILKTADHLMPLLKTTEVLDMTLPFNNLIHTVQLVLVPPASHGFLKMKLAIRSKGEKIQNITMPMLPERLRRQFEKAQKSDPPTPAASATSEMIRAVEAEILYEKHYQILTKILRKSSSAECNLCDLVKYLYIRSGNDGDNGKQLNDIIMGWGAEAANLAKDEETSELEPGASGSPSPQVHRTSATIGINLHEIERPDSKSASDRTSMIGTDTESSRMKSSSRRSSLSSRVNGVRSYEAMLNTVVTEGPETNESDELYDHAEREDFEEENSSRLSIPLGILRIEGQSLSGDGNKQSKSVRFSDNSLRASETTSISLKEIQKEQSDYEEFQKEAEGSMVEYDILDDPGYLAQIGARQIVDHDLFSIFQNSEEDVFSEYAHAADVIFSGGTLSLT